MTDTLLPAAPQPLEKEGDDYFRKVSGESTDPLTLSWQTAERAEGAWGRGRLGPEGEGKKGETRRVGAGRRAEKGGRKGIARGLEPRADGNRAGARRCTGEPHAGGNLGGDPDGPASLLALVGKGTATLASSVSLSALIPQLSFHPSA